MVEASSFIQNNNDPGMDPVIPKPEPIPEGSISSSVSTPEAEVEALTQDVTQTQKRKGGRKPVRKILFVCFIWFLSSIAIVKFFFKSGAPHSTVGFFSFFFVCLFFPLCTFYTYEHMFSLALPISHFFSFCFLLPFFNILYRSMPLRKNVSNAIGRPRLLFGSVAPNTSVSWSPPSSAMKTVYRPCSRITVPRLMSV